MMSQLRMDLLDEYCALYKERNKQSPKAFRDTYTKLSEIWLDLSDHERTAVNIRIFQNGNPSY